MGEIYTKITTIYSQWPQNILNVWKIYQMPQNKPTSSVARPPKFTQIWDFLFENIPSGNPGRLKKARARCIRRNYSPKKTFFCLAEETFSTVGTFKKKYF
jgi:hypothetical protein